jgi:hypothetical protein
MSYLHELGPVGSAQRPRFRPPASRAVAPVYRVGERFCRGRRDWPAGAEFAFGPGGHELTLFHPRIRPELIEDVRRGPAEFALIVRPAVLVLAYRFGETIPWDDAPYSWHLQPEFRRVIPASIVVPEVRSLLWINLVGAEDGLIHAQRGMTLSPPFTRALHDAIRAQAMSRFDPHDCTAAIAALYPPQLDTIDRLEMAVERTMGNA